MSEFTCAECRVWACRSHEMDRLPKNCPTRKSMNGEDIELYSEEELKISHEAALVESVGYGRHTRLEETMSFAYRMGYKKLGIGFCAGLKEEARVLAGILRENGFEVCAEICKCGSMSKSCIGIEDSEQVRPGQFEPMCNPAAQAERLNEEGTELNILLGLCVGHDSLFIKHSKAPVTVFVSKDRALAHNPIAAIYQSDAYLKRVHTFIKDEFHLE
ncbi:MAG: DUF1847 domain-containing protein [Eubacteriales bacterium]|nr:DUF1847 domain-containing protein [Eubacteriales bacterium]